MESKDHVFDTRKLLEGRTIHRRVGRTTLKMLGRSMPPPSAFVIDGIGQDAISQKYLYFVGAPQVSFVFL